MANESQSRGKKRSKAFYRKCAFGAKKHCPGGNVLESGIRGFLVTCNHDERGAVRECYNILNEYADILYGPDKNAGLHVKQGMEGMDNDEDDECDDMEKALKKEVEELKKASCSPEKRFQNVATKAKNCIFIRTSLEHPMEVTTHIMEDIAEKHLKKARHAARILPILGTCKANTKDIEKLASDILTPIFSNQRDVTYNVLFKMRNNNGTSCGRESVIPSLINVVKDINPSVKFSYTDYTTAIIVEVVCTVCCIGVAPDYFRLRRYNLQELQQGPKNYTPSSTTVESFGGNESVSGNVDVKLLTDDVVTDNQKIVGVANNADVKGEESGVEKTNADVNESAIITKSAEDVDENKTVDGVTNNVNVKGKEVRVGETNADASESVVFTKSVDESKTTDGVTTDIVVKGEESKFDIDLVKTNETVCV